MTKELEALKKISPCINCNTREKCSLCLFPDYYDEIQSALERLEKLEKAWEIVKNINAEHLRHIKGSISYSIYMEWYGIACEKDKCNLSEEDFNLLKEMLGENNESTKQ